MDSYYGAAITRGGINALLSWPAAKKVDTVAWAESDFVEADLSDIKLAAYEAAVGFGLSANPMVVAEMCSWLSANIYRTWNIASVGRSYKLRYVGCTSLTASQFLQGANITVALDNPMESYTYAAPVSHIASFPDYTMDDVRLSEYGVRVLLGTLDTTASPGSVKERLKRDISTIDGVEYDNAATNRLKAREIVLKCALIDDTFAGAWRNYDALLYDLIKKNNGAEYDTDRCKRSIYSHRLGQSFDCYYKSQSVTDFSPEGTRVWICFDLHLGVVGETAVDAYLATEDGAFVKTETGNYLIKI